MNLTSKQKLYFWLIIAFILLIDIALVIWMQKTTGNQGETNEETVNVKTLADALSLNEKQLDFFNVNEKEYSDLIDTLHQQINIRNKKITDKIFEENYDSSRLNQLIEEVGKLNDQVGKVRFKYLRKLKTVLNKDQLKKFKEIINESFVEWNDTLIVPYNKIYPPRPRKLY